MHVQYIYIYIYIYILGPVVGLFWACSRSLLTDIYIYTWAGSYICMCTHAYIIYVCIYVYMYTRWPIFMCIGLHACIHVHVYVGGFSYMRMHHTKH
jgi:hypothetical protein